MKPAVGIEIPGEQAQIMVALDENEIRVDEMSQGAVPPVEIRRDDGFAAAMLYRESMGWKQWIVGHFKSLKSQVPYFETALSEQFQSERAESASFEVFVSKLGNTLFMDSHFNIQIIEDSQRIVAYVIGVHVRNYDGINIKLIAQILSEHLPGSSHGTEATINQHSGVVSPDKQTVGAAAAA